MAKTSKRLTEESVEKSLENMMKLLTDPQIGLNSLSNKIAGSGAELKTLTKQVNHSETGLPGINDKLDALTADMFHVQKLAAGTYELLTHYVGKHKKEIKEIRRKTGIISDFD